MTRIQANFNLYAENLERAIEFYATNFNFKFLGNLDTKKEEKWAALRLENSIIWLGKNGASVGLILLIEKDLEPFVQTLKNNKVNFLIPEEMKDMGEIKGEIIITDWGKHAWFHDSEHNVIMLFEPAEG